MRCSKGTSVLLLSGWTFAFLTFGASASVSAEVSKTCYRIPLDPAPRSVGNGAWSPKGTSFVLTDIRGGRVIEYGRDGASLKVVSRPGQGRLEFQFPTQVFSADNGYLLKDGVDHLIWLDEELEPIRALDFRQSAEPSDLSPGVEYLALLDQTQTGNEIAAFGIVNGEAGLHGGFLRIDSRTLEVKEIVEDVPADSASRQWYYLLGNYVAQAGGTAYALRWDDPPFILRLSPPHGPLDAFPADYRRLPALPQNRGPESDPERYGALERFTVAEGLYGRGSHLYLSTRRPDESGRTLWELFQIDPVGDKIVGSVMLPTAAKHILLIPGIHQWILIEKESLLEFGHQDILQAVVVPSDWIESPGASPLAENEPPNCD